MCEKLALQRRIGLHEGARRGTRSVPPRPPPLPCARNGCVSPREGVDSIGPRVQQALASWKVLTRFSSPEDFVFSMRTPTPVQMDRVPVKVLKPAGRRIGVEPLAWHDLRHTFCTLGRREGIPAEVMQRLMRHSDIRTTLEIYSHVTDDDAVRVIEGEKVLPPSATYPWGRGTFDSMTWGERLAPQVGLEPTTLRLTAGCSTIELLRSRGGFCLIFMLSKRIFDVKRRANKALDRRCDGLGAARWLPVGLTIENHDKGLSRAR